MKGVSGISLCLPANFSIDMNSLNNLKRAEGNYPEPMPIKKTVRIVSGGSYGSTYSNKTPEENLIRFLAWKEELSITLKNLKKVDLPDLRNSMIPAKSNVSIRVLNKEDASKDKESTSLQPYKTENASAVVSIFDKNA